jgi:hypothetical protein
MVTPHYSTVCRAILGWAAANGKSVDDVTADDLAAVLPAADRPSPEMLFAAKNMLRTDRLVNDSGYPNEAAAEWLDSGQELPALLSIAPGWASRQLRAYWDITGETGAKDVDTCLRLAIEESAGDSEEIARFQALRDELWQHEFHRPAPG